MPWARLIRGSRSKLKTLACLAASTRSDSTDSGRVEEAEHERALGHQRRLLGGQGLDPHHGGRPPVEGRGVGGHRRPRRPR